MDQPRVLFILVSLDVVSKFYDFIERLPEVEVEPVLPNVGVSRLKSKAALFANPGCIVVMHSLLIKSQLCYQRILGNRAPQAFPFP